MKQFLPILALVCVAASPAWTQQSAAPQPSAQAAQAVPSGAPAVPTDKTPVGQIPVDVDKENARKAKALIDQAIEALGGAAYLNIHDRELTGRTFGFHHGRSSGNGVEFWSFSEFPDKERVELTKQRDITELYVGNRAWEITYKGPKPIEPKDLDDYLRRRRFSLDTILRTWVNDPGVVVLFEGAAIAAQHPTEQITLINSQNESVTLYFDTDTHLPVKKSFSWRDPVDRQKNLEEEVYENYRAVSGIMAPYNLTRYFNGDMASQRFLNSVTINQALDEAMFDPHSGYNPNKPPGKQAKKH